MIRILSLEALLLMLSLCCAGSAIETESTSQHHDLLQTDGVVKLAVRLLGKDSQRFAFTVKSDTILPKHNAVLRKSSANKLSISANSGVAAAWALHYYLTQFCSGLVAWSGAQVSLPAGKLPELPGGELRLISQDNYTVMPNVVTFCYTYAWWDFNRWERHIDWMALHGVNLVYSLNAQETVFRNVFLRMGISEAEIDQYFAGPAFLTWNRMGNLKGWGGPLPAQWYSKQLQLQQQILQRLLSLGINPVLQGFSGMVPDAFIKKYPDVNYTRLSNWNNFGSNYSEIIVIDPTEPMFVNISAEIMRESISVFGDVTNFFAMDTFNENQPGRTDLSYISGVSDAIYRGLSSVKPNGIWLLQNWFFLNEAAFWTIDRVKAFLQPVPLGQLLILDMAGDSRGGGFAASLEGYFGHQFLLTVVHDYGGNNAMYGGMSVINQRGPWPLRRQFPENMAGTGIVPEGLLQNEIMYEFILEFNWRRQPVSEIFWATDFARRRYNTRDETIVNVWALLQSSLYNCPTSSQVIPLLKMRPSLTLSEYVYYDTRVVEKAWRLLIQANSSHNQMLAYDQVDLTRQMLQIRFNQFYMQLVRSAAKNDTDSVRKSGTELENLLISMNWLLQSRKEFLLQPKIEAAKSFARSNSSSEQKLYEFNIRNQLTQWGPGPYNIPDYAGKMYNGLIYYYYLPRWQMFIAQLIDDLQKGQKFDQNKFVNSVFNKVERPFYLSNVPVGPVTPIGEAQQAAKTIAATLPAAPTDN